MNNKITIDDINPGFIYQDQNNFLLALKETNKNEVIMYCLNSFIIMEFPIPKNSIVEYINNNRIIYVK